MTPDTQTVGVVVGRFQVDSLHQGHLHLLTQVAARHRRLLVCVGVTPHRTRHDPLDYVSRAKMIQAAFPQAAVVPLRDVPGDDTVWSRHLDDTIASIFPLVEAILYGARGSFLPHYTGKWPTKEIDGGPEISGTSRRALVGAEIRDSEDFRAGQIHVLQNQRAPWYPCVDIAVLRGSGDVLLGQKRHEMKLGRYRFVGGLVDDTDRTLADAAKRELAEETGIEVDGLEMVETFLMDSQIEPGTRFLTTLFLAHYVYGSTFKPMDDIAALSWIPLRRIRDFLIPLHQPLGAALLKVPHLQGAPCSTVCTGFKYHQPGCPEFVSGAYTEVAAEKA